jgi:hypothetical protein
MVQDNTADREASICLRLGVGCVITKIDGGSMGQLRAVGELRRCCNRP